jgi:hypothetical protein
MIDYFKKTEHLIFLGLAKIKSCSNILLKRDSEKDTNSLNENVYGNCFYLSRLQSLFPAYFRLNIF